MPTPTNQEATESTNSQVHKKIWVPESTRLWIWGAILLSLAFFVIGTIIDNQIPPTDKVDNQTQVVDKHENWYRSWPDYSHEIASAVLGTILTIAVTAFLLRIQQENAAKLQQEQLEAEKEREIGAKFFEEKLKIYGILLKGLEEFLQCTKLRDEDFTKLSLTCLHVSYIADSTVLEKLEGFTSSLLSIIREDSEEIDRGDEYDEGRDPITHAERKTVLSKFSEVAAMIKTDLDKSRTSRKKKPNDVWDAEPKCRELRRLDKSQSIIDNLSLCSIAYVEAERRLKRRRGFTSSLMGKDSFLAACSNGDEKIFYEKLLGILLRKDSDYQILWTHRGFSLERTIKFFAYSESKDTPCNVINRPAQTDRARAVEKALEQALNGTCHKKFVDKNIKFTWNDMKKDAPINETIDAWMTVIKKVLKPLEPEDRKTPPQN